MAGDGVARLRIKTDEQEGNLRRQEELP